MEMLSSFPQYWLTRFIFQRSLAFIYFIGFLMVVNQFIPLLGEHGILPVPLFLKRVRFWDSPSLFLFHFTDSFALSLGWTGLALSLFALSGYSEKFGLAVSMLTWGTLWFFYLSFVNVGQIFYGYGWESLLLETGFLSIFLGSAQVSPPVVLIWLFRWILFRLMFGAGMIKLRGDSCWRDLTCMFYHYETQPLPNPLSRTFHFLPKSVHKLGVLFTHFVEILLPWAYFAPHPFRTIAGLLTIFFQITLILSGNLSWLNYITIVLCLTCFDDSFFSKLVSIKVPAFTPITPIYLGALVLVCILVLCLSVQPAKNLFSPGQMMNASFDSFHLVNTYGAFGSITRERYEIILEGTQDPFPSQKSQWKEYEFKCKPGSITRTPCVVSPYHLKIDWQMWFAAMSSAWNHPWIFNFIAKLLEGDPRVIGLLAHNPFPHSKPTYIRAELYLYHFAPQSQTHPWKRTYVGPYLPALSLKNPQFRSVLEQMDWLEAG